MEMVPVQSSNVASIGYSPVLSLMRVRFKNGSTYDWPGTSPEIHKLVMASESKGRAIAALGRGRRVEGPEEIKLPEPVRDAIQSRPLNVIEPDPCCTPRFAKAAPSLENAESWTCPKCGVEYRPVMVGPVRNWVAHVYVCLVKA